jgi:predicted ATP-grasp superfamily ATP-dependent carboligase
MRHAREAGERVLVLGDDRQTLTVVRSLARAGYEVTLGTDDAHSSTALSRYLADIWTYEWSGVNRFYNQLEGYLRCERPDYVFTVGESQLRWLLRAAGRFERLATWASADFATLTQCFDKRALYALTRQLGIPTLPWQECSSVDAWRQAAQEMGYPVVVKPKDSTVPLQHKKAIICRTPEELERSFADPDPASLVMQKFARGARHNCHFAAAEGKLVAYFEQIGGVSVAPSAQLREHCASLLRQLRYHGIGCIQFMVDARSGSIAFLGLNPRMESAAPLPYRLGYDFPLLAVQLAASRRTGKAVAPLDVPYACGKKYHPTWDLRDPLPTLHQLWRSVGRPLVRRFHPRTLKHV